MRAGAISTSPCWQRQGGAWGALEEGGRERVLAHVEGVRRGEGRVPLRLGVEWDAGGRSLDSLPVSLARDAELLVRAQSHGEDAVEAAGELHSWWVSWAPDGYRFLERPGMQAPHPLMQVFLCLPAHAILS